MSWFSKLIPEKIRTNTPSKGNSVPEGLWTKCTACQHILFKSELEKALMVCPKCGHHMRLSARDRLSYWFDEGVWEPIGANIIPQDKLKFKDSKRYKDRLSTAQKTTGESDALLVGYGKLQGMPVVTAAFDFAFIGGSMGSVVGERFLQGVMYAITHRCPFICFATSGGARMQESLFSLMQMAKTSAALQRLSAAQLPYISVMVDPCMGGVSASLAMLGDINLAEPNALIGFAGPRVIEQTVRQTLPPGFQRSEFLLEKGAIDQIVARADMRDTVYRMLSALTQNVTSPVRLTS